MLIVFDLDDTLGCTKHRRHHIVPQSDTNPFKPDWDSFFNARHADPVIMPMAKTLRTFYVAGFDVEIWTAAREDSRSMAMQWIQKNLDVPASTLTLMRQHKDYRKSADLKSDWMKRYRPDMIFDDNLNVIAAARELGIFACGVGDNAY